MNKFLFYISVLYFIFFGATKAFSQNYFLARTSGKLPALLYGEGDDRLGGAKMGYIDTNVLIRVLDTANPLACKIKLSNNRNAFIERQYFTIDTASKEKKSYTSGNFNVLGTDGCYDIITINLQEKLPYRSWMQINPSTIQIEIFGTQSNTNWIIQKPSLLKEVANVYYNQTNEDVMLVTIELKHKQHWGYSINYIKNQLCIKVKRQPLALNIKNIKIGIDAGHGGTNTGAAGATTKLLEKNLTLLFAMAFEKYLIAQGVKTVIMTRNKDTSLEMKDRISFLQEQNPDFVISFHLNSNNQSSIKGCGTFYRYIGFRPPSITILNQMLSTGLDEYANVGNFNFGLNGPTDFVNTLLEVGFLSNVDDEKKIIDPSFHNQTAIAIYNGIVDWLEQVKKDNL